MIMIMCSSLLTGCGEVPEKIPEPEELISNAFGLQETTSVRALVKLDTDLDIDMSSIGISNNIKISRKMNVEMAGNKNGSMFANGCIEYDILGINGAKEIEVYEIADEYSTKVYTFNENTSTWGANTSIVKNGEHLVKAIVSMVNIENFAKNSLSIEAGVNDYTVKGIVNSEDLKNNIEMLSRLTGSENLISSDISLNISMKFDKTTRLIQNITFTINTETTPETIKAAYNNLSLSIEIYEINTVNIEIPQEILNQLNGNLETQEDSKTEIVD